MTIKMKHEKKTVYFTDLNIADANINQAYNICMHVVYAIIKADNYCMLCDVWLLGMYAPLRKQCQAVDGQE